MSAVLVLASFGCISNPMVTDDNFLLEQLSTAAIIG